MTSRPELEAMLEELRELDERNLRFTLSVMRPQEQAEIMELLDARPMASLNFETLSGISSWLTERLESARRGDRTSHGRVAMTKATRDALNAAFTALGSAPTHAPLDNQASRSSWLDRFMRRPIKSASA